MTFIYNFMYIFTILYCVANTLIIMFKLNYNVGSDVEIRAFRKMALSYIGFLILELVWITGTAGILPIGMFMASLAKIIDTMLIPLMVYFWFIFASIRFRAKWVNSTRNQLIAFIPVLIMVVLYVVSIKTGMVFSIDAKGEIIEGPMAALTGIVDNLYGLAIILYAVYFWFKDKTRFQKGEYMRQIAFILICTAGGMIDAAIRMTPVMPLTITLSFNFLFMNLLEGQIYNDALTGLNNRRRADDFIKESISSSSEDSPCYYFMIDVNHFKAINDTYGHIEGDNALKMIAKGLRKVAGTYHALISRYGGDEFVILVRDAEDFDVEEFMADINSSLEEVIKDKNTPYELTVSIGYSKCISDQTKLQELLSEADAMMYEAKKSER